MAAITAKLLLEAGVQFGHRTWRSNPKMRPYIFAERNGVHIIDLRQTVPALEKALALVRDTVAEGGTILFVGTRREAQDAIAQEAVRCGMFYVNQRWLGGTLTDWRATRARIEDLLELEAGEVVVSVTGPRALHVRAIASARIIVVLANIVFASPSCWQVTQGACTWPESASTISDDSSTASKSEP